METARSGRTKVTRGTLEDANFGGTAREVIAQERKSQARRGNHRRSHSVTNEDGVDPGDSGATTEDGGVSTATLCGDNISDKSAETRGVAIWHWFCDVIQTME